MKKVEKIVLEFEDLEELLASNARGSRIGVVAYSLVYALFSSVMFFFSWILALICIAIMSLLGYYIYLGSKEKSALLQQLRDGNFRLLLEPITEKVQEKSGGMFSYYFHLDEKRRLYVSREEYTKALKGHKLITLYVGDVKLPQYYFHWRKYRLGESLAELLVVPEEKEEQ